MMIIKTKNADQIDPAEWPFDFFTPQEVACKHCGKVAIHPEAMQALEGLNRVRSVMGEPIHLVSAYRCPQHNAAVGGAKFSAHMNGTAFDVAWDKWKAYKRRRFLFVAGAFGFNGLGQYRGFVHIDQRDGFGFWAGS